MSKHLSKAEYIGADKHLNICCKKAGSFPLHGHDYFELEMIISGSGTHILNGRKYFLSPGYVYLLTPSDFHEINAESDLLLWNISFDETLITDARCEEIFLSKPNYFPDKNKFSRLCRAAKLLEEETALNENIQPIFEYILALVTESSGGKSLSQFEKTILYIQTHFRESPTLAQAAKQACLSPVYFGNIFKKITGETYISYINTLKTDCAKMLLENGISVTEACFQAGFGSLSGFLHVFKQKTGMSPLKYKKAFLKQKK